MTVATSPADCGIAPLPAIIQIVSSTDPVQISASQREIKGYELLLCMTCKIHANLEKKSIFTLKALQL